MIEPAERRSSPFMRFTENLTALRAWCTRCLPGRWKPDVLRAGIVRRDARVYGHTTVVEHDMSTTPPPSTRDIALSHSQQPPSPPSLVAQWDDEYYDNRYHLCFTLGALHGSNVRPAVLGAAACGVRSPEAPRAVPVAALVTFPCRPLLFALHAACLLLRFQPLFLRHA